MPQPTQPPGPTAPGLAALQASLLNLVSVLGLPVATAPKRDGESAAGNRPASLSNTPGSVSRDGLGKGKRSSVRRSVIAILLFLCAGDSPAAIRSWTNSAGGNWFVAANWSPNFVPNLLDTANITNNGTYTVTIGTGTVAVAVLNLGGTGGTQTLLAGTPNAVNVTNLGTVRANGILTVTNGGLQGRLLVQSGGQLQLSGAALKTLYSLTLINQGTVTWSAGQLNGGNTPTTVISNGGLWEITGDNSFV